MTVDLCKKLKEAFCKALACTGIGAAEGNCDDVLTKNVKKTVPVSMQSGYPGKLLECVTKVCIGEPYKWGVDQKVPDISDTTTFKELYDKWFEEIVWPNQKGVNE
jgi:hypothetical protein